MVRTRAHYDQEVAKEKEQRAQRTAELNQRWERINDIAMEFLLVGTAILGIVFTAVLLFGNQPTC